MEQKTHQPTCSTLRVSAGSGLIRDFAETEGSSLELIYGGGTNGVMGAVGLAALKNGGKVGAIIDR